MISSLKFSTRLLSAVIPLFVCVVLKGQTQVTSYSGAVVGTLQSPGVSASVNQDSWIGFSFTTGSSVGGYDLTSISVQIAQLSVDVNPPAALFPGSGGLPSGAALATFTTVTPLAPSPSFATASYTPTSSFTLLANTEYVFLIAPASGSTGTWDWGITNGSSSSTGWSMSSLGAVVFDPDRDGAGPDTGSGPGILAGTPGFFMMSSVEATAIPEPATTALISSLSLFAVAAIYRRRVRST